MPSKLLWLMIVNVSLNLACYILPPNNGDSYSSIPCVFPFKYKGLTFHACTKAFDFQRKLWCSVKVNDDGEHSEGDGNWGHCDIATCVDIERAVDPNNRICQTVGEISPQIRDCVFPFTFDGKVFHSCTSYSDLNRRAWCSYQTDEYGQHVTGNWDYCQCSGTESSPKQNHTNNEKKSSPLTVSEESDSTCEIKAIFKEDFPLEGDFLPDLKDCGEKGTSALNVEFKYPPFEEALESDESSYSEYEYTLPPVFTVLSSLERQTRSLASDFGINAPFNHQVPLFGAIDVLPGEFPFTAAIGYKVDTSSGPKVVYKCGGSLINRRYVLTAAHCLPENGNHYEVKLGEIDFEKDCDCLTAASGKSYCMPKPQRILIESVVKHEKYRGRRDKLKYDIALIRLAKPAQITQAVQPICLPLAEEKIKGFFNETNLVEGLASSNSMANSVGWGKTTYEEDFDVSETNVQHPILQVGEIPIRKFSNCHRTHRGEHIDSATQFCAGTRGRDACSGDSGGPLFKRGPDDLMIQFGIVSFGDRICARTRPTVYTGVVHFVPWIKANLRK